MDTYVEDIGGRIVKHRTILILKILKNMMNAHQ
nr:MAG TPA: hypothetical protein [Crassvirales sp.]